MVVKGMMGYDSLNTLIIRLQFIFLGNVAVVAFVFFCLFFITYKTSVVCFALSSTLPLLFLSSCGSNAKGGDGLRPDPAPWWPQDESHKFPYNCKQLQVHEWLS